MRSSATLNRGPEDQSTAWILYRFKLSRLLGDQKALLNRAFLLSCDKYYCIASIDGARRMLLAEGKKLYDDLITPEAKGYTILEKLFKKVLEDYLSHYTKSTGLSWISTPPASENTLSQKAGHEPRRRTPTNLNRYREFTFVSSNVLIKVSGSQPLWRLRSTSFSNKPSGVTLKI